MRDKELRLALVCYGGVSLAVYMHGITKEVWRLAKASQAHHAAGPPSHGSEAVYRELLETLAQQTGINLRVLTDILAGASAGGINAVFLSHAIATGHSLDPLTKLWLDSADVDELIEGGLNPVAKFLKWAAVPFAWMLASRSGTVNQTVDPKHRAEVRRKLASFVRARWFAPPFGGKIMTGLLLDAFQAMDRTPVGPPLLPEYQPLDLFVTVTDFHGFPERLRLNSPPEVVETEHRLTLAFRDRGGKGRRLAAAAELTYAARATSSFPGAFPPFRVGELDHVLAERNLSWGQREAFLARAVPRHAAIGEAEQAVLIDGSVLANAPFGPCIAALGARPASREVDRRFVYIDPRGGLRGGKHGNGDGRTPGFFATIFGAMSDIPREQPIRDNLEAIEQRSVRIRRLRRVVELIRPEVEAAIADAFGTTFFLLGPTPRRLASWRAKANDIAARESGYAYAAYGQLKLSTVVEDCARLIFRIGGEGDAVRWQKVRRAIWTAARGAELTASDAVTARGARPDVVLFLRNYDVGFRIRRLRFLARHLAELAETIGDGREALDQARASLYPMIGRYEVATDATRASEAQRAAFEAADVAPEAALEQLAALLDLRALDAETDQRITDSFGSLPRKERRAALLGYLGYPFYDIATLPLLQGEGLDEFNPIRVDRISPDDATAIREGGARATLKGIQFNSFGAFFSRAYRENDYLWGRLHGADRLIDIVVSTLPSRVRLPPGVVASLKRRAFRAILTEEKGRLTSIPNLFKELEHEIGQGVDL